MARKEVKTSHLLDSCKYINKLIEIPNPWQEPDFNKAMIAQFQKFGKMKVKYDWAGISPHILQSTMSKIDTTAFELKMKPLEDKSLEVFIPNECNPQCRMEDKYIHVHTQIENHPGHNWDASEWIKENLPDLPIVDTGFGGKWYCHDKNINVTFKIAKHATHRVYSSSVMVHAADAMGLTIDIINYGKQDTKVWPLDQSKVLHIRECGEMLR